MSQLIGYARVSTRKQDKRAQLAALEEMGVDQLFVDEGITGAKRARPGLDQALAASRKGDTFVVTKLDRLGRSTEDLGAIARELQEKGVKLCFNGKVYDPLDPMDRLLFNALAMAAEFERDLLRLRTREGMAIAKASGNLKGRAPKLSPYLEDKILDEFEAGEKTSSQIAGEFGIGRATAYRARDRARERREDAA